MTTDDDRGTACQSRIGMSEKGGVAAQDVECAQIITRREAGVEGFPTGIRDAFPAGIREDGREQFLKNHLPEKRVPRIDTRSVVPFGRQGGGGLGTMSLARTGGSLGDWRITGRGQRVMFAAATRACFSLPRGYALLLG